jgi:hypothetical protein
MNEVINLPPKEEDPWQIFTEAKSVAAGDTIELNSEKL